MRQLRPSLRIQSALIATGSSAGCRGSFRVGRRSGLPGNLVLRDNSFEPRDVFQETLAGEDQEVIAELRILKVDLEQLFIGDRQNLSILEAFDRPRAPVVG